MKEQRGSNASSRLKIWTHRRDQGGFTLIEMMTVVSLIALIAALAAPDLRAFMVRNKVAGVGNEFAAALQHPDVFHLGSQRVGSNRRVCQRLWRGNQGV